MNLARVQAIADAILYEGYALYPYRASSLKNHHRWMFGTLSPRGVEPWALSCECLLEARPGAALSAKVRFLQKDVPREVDLGPLGIEDLGRAPHRQRFSFEAKGHTVEGEAEIATAPLESGVYRVAVRVVNLTEPSPSTIDDDVALRSLASTHVLLGAREGEFVSLLDPPEALRVLAEGCRNIGAWPILVGDPGDRDIMLCSPIILYDYPAVAPESPGDFFDATEIDEMLALRILTLSAEEREEAASFDPRVRALLARTEAMSPAEMARLHGAKRRAGHGGGSRPHAPGDQVRLCPKGRADVFDLALAGQIATIASIEEDVDQRVFVTVTLDDDPGRDLGLLGQPGHRFFFRLDEIEPLSDDERRR